MGPCHVLTRGMLHHFLAKQLLIDFLELTVFDGLLDVSGVLAHPGMHWVIGKEVVNVS